MPTLDGQEKREKYINKNFVEMVNDKRRHHEKVRSIVNYDSMYQLQ